MSATSASGTLVFSPPRSESGSIAFRRRNGLKLQLTPLKVPAAVPPPRTGPNVTNLPRRRRKMPPARRPSLEVEPVVKQEPVYHTLIPGVSLAVVPDSIQEDMLPSFDYIVLITEPGAPSVSNPRIMHVPVADSPRDDGCTRLSEKQLLEARNFLTGVLPAPLSGFEERYAPINPDDVLLSPEIRILIACTVPAASCDVMSVASCYLAHASGDSVHDVLMRFNSHISTVNTAALEVLALREEQKKRTTVAEQVNSMHIADFALHLKDGRELTPHEKRRLKRERDMEHELEKLGLGAGTSPAAVDVTDPMANRGNNADSWEIWHGCVSLDGMDFAEDVARL